MELEALQKKYSPYLMEIRKRLFLIAVLFIGSGLVGFFTYERILKFVLSLLQLEGVNIVFTSPFQFMELAVSTGIFLGIITTFPLILYNTISFIRPALTKKEYRILKYLIPFGIILFLIGFSIGFAIMKFVVFWFYQKSQDLNIGNLLDVSKLLSQVIITSGLMGLAFQFPLVMTLLIKLKVVSRKFFSKQRPIAYGASILFAALMPPTDLLSLLILTLPLVILFESTLLLNKVL